MTKRRKWKDSVKDSVKEIAKYQRGERKPLDTGFSHLNENALGGLLPGDIITIGGLSGHGKTFFLQRIENNLISLNPDADIALLRLNFEMSVQKLVLRRLKLESGLKMTQILLEQPDEARKALFKSIVDKERLDYIDHIEEALTAEEFLEECTAFLEENVEKTNCIITIDHIALIKASSTEKKTAVDRVMEHCINLKKLYHNVTFIILTQLNREIEGRTNRAELQPKMGDIYQSSTMAFASDLIIVVHNPYKLGHKEYMVVNRDDHDYMEEFFVPSNGKKESAYVSFATKTTIFYHYIKVRTPDGEDYREVFGEFFGKKRAIQTTNTKESIDEF